MSTLPDETLGAVEKVLELADLYPAVGVLAIGALITGGVLYTVRWVLRNFRLRKEE